jgi:carbamoyltransferase
VLTADGMGDGRCATAWLGGPDGLRPLRSFSGRAAINTFYSRITEWLGFNAMRHEGKVTGLAALAEPPPALLAHMGAHLNFRAGRFSTEDYHWPQHPDDAFFGELRAYSRAEVAAAAQATLEAAVCDWVRHEMQQTGVQDVALAGGLFGNVKVNQRIAALPGLRSLWISPNMGDGGLAVGAALLAAEAPLLRLQHVNLGPDIPAEAAAQAATGLRALPGPALDGAAAVLARGGAVARAAGRMEFGPRALGSRSIFAPAHDPAINQRLNAALQRSDFMPFAPMIRSEDAPALLIRLDRAPEAARFMTLCFDCTPAMRAEAPAAVHVDGTARPQVVHAAEAPALHALLTAYQARTGRRVLLNTSFNLHEEPIVHTAEDAVRTFARSGLDALWLGDRLLGQAGAPDPRGPGG